MRKVGVSCLFIVLGTLVLNGQTPKISLEVLLRLGNDVLRINDKAQIQIQDEMTLSDGTAVYPDGSYRTQDRKKLQLLEGESLDNHGIKYRNEYQYRYKVEQENKELELSTIQERNQNRYLVVLIKGRIFKIKNSEQYIIQEPVDIGFGKVVDLDGIYRTSYGHARLKDGGCITLKGLPIINLYEYRKTIARKLIRESRKLDKKEN
ncbi:hypothetical protein N9954_00385 [Maribacter sp.]|nr:hypothetical protein [Maribacter sp.]